MFREGTMSKWMELAVQSAYEGIEKDEGGPFGACIVNGKGEAVAVTHNTVLKDRDPTCHAEMNCIRQASQRLGSHILDDCEIYTTAEPCPMCLAAIYWARIKKIHVGVKRDCAARYGFDDAFFYEQLELPTDIRQVPAEQGDSEEACEQVFARWKSLNRSLY